MIIPLSSLLLWVYLVFPLFVIPLTLSFLQFHKLFHPLLFPTAIVGTGLSLLICLFAVFLSLFISMSLLLLPSSCYLAIFLFMVVSSANLNADCGSMSLRYRAARALLAFCTTFLTSVLTDTVLSRGTPRYFALCDHSMIWFLFGFSS